MLKKNIKNPKNSGKGQNGYFESIPVYPAKPNIAQQLHHRVYVRFLAPPSLQDSEKNKGKMGILKL